MRRNVEEVAKLTPSQIATIERISEERKLPVNIEQIANGVVVYVGDTFSRERLLEIRSKLLQNVDLLDPSHLPDHYVEWFDSFTGERFYFQVSGGEKFVQVVSALFKSFLQDERTSEILSRVREKVLDD